MTASDHLSSVQFVPLHDLEGYRSGDHEGHTVGEAVHGLRSVDPYRVESIADDMAMEGQREPVEYMSGPGGRSLVNGHHRVAAARRLQLKGLEATEVSESPHG